jgi:hypothetical protein
VPALFATNWFIHEQIAEAPSAPAITLSDQARIVAQQLGNAYGLLFMLGVAVLDTSTELKVVRNYLVALLLADIGHVGLTIVALGARRFAAVGEWNAMTWGNVGFTVCLNVPLLSHTLHVSGIMYIVHGASGSAHRRSHHLLLRRQRVSRLRVPSH